MGKLMPCPILSVTYTKIAENTSQNLNRIQIEECCFCVNGFYKHLCLILTP